MLNENIINFKWKKRDGAANKIEQSIAKETDKELPPFVRKFKSLKFIKYVLIYLDS